MDETDFETPLSRPMFSRIGLQFRPYPLNPQGMAVPSQQIIKQLQY